MEDSFAVVVLSSRSDPDPEEEEGQDRVSDSGPVAVGHMDPPALAEEDTRPTGSFDFDNTHWPYLHP